MKQDEVGIATKCYVLIQRPSLMEYNCCNWQINLILYFLPIANL